MKKTLIKDYAKLHNVTVQSVYAKIKKGTLFSSIIDKHKYILECDDDSDDDSLKDEIKELKNRENRIIKECSNKIKKCEKEKIFYYNFFIISFMFLITFILLFSYATFCIISTNNISILF